MSSIGVLGLGAMGSRMAVNYANAGHDVTVWNRTPDVADELATAHGMSAATSIQQAVGEADVVVSMVTNDDAANAIWLGDHGAFASMRPGSISIESSTLTPRMVRELAAAANMAEMCFV
ncbi:MAG: NAD(P)-binding domain-containing protein, partial [Actinomycetota bacterium]